MQHTKESIRALLLSNDRAVERAVVVLTELQTADELASETTKVQNGQGWNARDAKFGTSLAKSVKDWGRLTSRQLVAARRMVLKYAGQLARVANAKAAPVPVEAPVELKIEADFSPSQEVCNRCGVIKCPDGCCCGC